MLNKLHLFGRFCASLKVKKIGRKVFPLLDAVSLTLSRYEPYQQSMKEVPCTFNATGGQIRNGIQYEP